MTKCPHCKKAIAEKIKESTEEILTSKEAANFLGYAYQTVRNFVHEGRIPYRGRQGRPRFFKSELIAWVNAGMPDNWIQRQAGRY